jgi:hypothetical protein
MKNTPLTTHLLEKLGFESKEQEANSDDWLIHVLPNNEALYISSYFEKGQDGRDYLFIGGGSMIETISTLKDLYECLKICFDIGNLSKEQFLEIEKKIENI